MEPWDKVVLVHNGIRGSAWMYECVRGCGKQYYTRANARYHWTSGCADLRLRANQGHDHGNEAVVDAREDLQPGEELMQEVGEHDMMMAQVSEDSAEQSDAVSGQSASGNQYETEDESADSGQHSGEEGEAQEEGPAAVAEADGGDAEGPLELPLELLVELPLDADAYPAEDDEFIQEPPPDPGADSDGEGVAGLLGGLLLYEWDLSDEDEEIPEEEREEAAGAEGGAEDEGREGLLRGLEYYRQHLADPIWPNARMSVIQYCYTRLTEKQRSKTKDTQFNRDSRLMAEYFCPEENFVPPSLYLVKKVMETREARECERHVCVCGRYAFPHLQPSQYDRNEECGLPDCHEKRFDQVPARRGYRLVPKRRFWYFGLAAVVRDRMFTDTTWCARRATQRDEYEHNFWNSREATRLHSQTQDVLLAPETAHKTASWYELGIDWGQPFFWKTWSSGYIMIRCGDIPWVWRSLRQFTHMVIIIPGPSEPKLIQPYLQEFLSDLGKYGPTGGGLLVTNHCKDAHGVIIKQKMRHIIILGGSFGDTPAQRKLSLWLSHMAYLACGYCWLLGTRGPNNAGMYFQGYETPTACGWALAGGPAVSHRNGGTKGAHMCSHPGIKLTDAQQRDRAGGVMNNIPGREIGCWGWSPIIEALSYIDYNNFWIIPMAHCLLYGVVRGFWKLVLAKPAPGNGPRWYTLPQVHRRILKDRAGHIIATLDFNRPYRDIVERHNQWTMEEWLHFTEAWAPYLLSGYSSPQIQGGHILHDPRLREMWALLRDIVLHYCRVTPGNGTPAAQLDAHQKLMQYARLVSQHLGVKACTYNLHLLCCRCGDEILWWACQIYDQCCRAYNQEQQRGQSGLELEFWVENEVQLSKSTTKFRTSGNPEVLLVNQILLMEAIKRAPSIWPHLRSYNELIYGSATTPDRGRNLDVPYDPETKAGFVGNGRRPRNADLERLRAATVLHLGDFPREGWTEAACNAASFLLYDRADLGEPKDYEVIHCLEYRMPKSRKSYFARAEYDAEGIYVALIQNFLKAALADGPGGEIRVLRLALCDLYKAQELPGWSGSVLHVRAGVNPSKRGYPVALEHIQHKVAWCNATKGKPQYKKNFWRFVSYSNTYSRQDP